MIFSEGNIAQIEGTWNNDNLESCKLLTMRDGSTATNYQPKAGKLIGEGYVKVGESKFAGNWDESGRLNGKATVENENNQGWFQGIFKDNLREGEGKYVWPNNQGEYVGTFKNGLRHTGPDGPDA